MSIGVLRVGRVVTTVLVAIASVLTSPEVVVGAWTNGPWQTGVLTLLVIGSGSYAILWLLMWDRQIKPRSRLWTVAVSIMVGLMVALLPFVWP